MVFQCFSYHKIEACKITRIFAFHNKTNENYPVWFQAQLITMDKNGCCLKYRKIFYDFVILFLFFFIFVKHND